MRKNRLFILGIITVMVALVSLSLVSSTFAKYTSNATATDTAKVAKWSVKVNNTEIAQTGGATKELTIDLFDTAKVYDITTGSDDANVKNGETEAIIAPGTKGSFTINLQNLSDVTAKYTVTFAVTGAVPLQFKLNGASEWSDSLSSVTETEIAMTNGSADVVVEWQWPFEAVSPNTNVKDTDLGIAAETVTVTATILFVQVD